MRPSRTESDLLADLESGPLHWFRDWPHPGVPAVAAGVYTVWMGVQLVYVGMSGRGLSTQGLAEHKGAGGKPKGLTTRLASHASGRRSGDQFCVYVADRLVLPLLTPQDIQLIAAGSLSLDRKVREYIHANLDYRFVEVEDGPTAHRIEASVRRGALKAGTPLLNPHLGGARRQGML